MNWWVYRTVLCIKLIYHLCFYPIKQLKFIYLCFKQRKLAQKLLSKEYKILHLTHGESGGTLLYTQRSLATKKEYLIVSNVQFVWPICYAIQDSINKNKVYITKKDFDKIWKKQYDLIEVNSLTTYYEVFTIINKILEYKKRNIKTYLTYSVHDFHCICPKYNLVARGEFCDLECSSKGCKPQFTYGSFKYVTSKTWRMNWKKLLNTTDEIRCFSISSKEIILQAYPTLSENKITVVPHDVSYIKFSPIKGGEKLLLHIGVVGNCNSDMKGRGIIRKIIHKYGNDIPITLVGSDYKHYKVKARYVKFMGQYQQRDLQRIIEQEKISCVLFPSVCPETFSYLVSELISMDIPIICFNYGAQAEKVRKYDKGIVVDNEEELNAILTEMQKMKTWGNFIENH